MRYFMRALQIMAIVSEWSTQALEDGKVTAKELVDLGERVCQVLGVKTEFSVDLEA